MEYARPAEGGCGLHDRFTMEESLRVTRRAKSSRFSRKWTGTHSTHQEMWSRSQRCIAVRFAEWRDDSVTGIALWQ
jgi:nuclear transport factor 2 (NTF2) superfamily protein